MVAARLMRSERVVPSGMVGGCEKEKKFEILELEREKRKVEGIVGVRVWMWSVSVWMCLCGGLVIGGL